MWTPREYTPFNWPLLVANSDNLEELSTFAVKTRELLSAGLPSRIRKLDLVLLPSDLQAPEVKRLVELLLTVKEASFVLRGQPTASDDDSDSAHVEFGHWVELMEEPTWTLELRISRTDRRPG